jgi:hypothetical protein
MRLPIRLIFAAVFLMGSILVAAERPNFSGSYTLKSGKGDSKSSKGSVWTLSVTQTDLAIEVTRVMDGQKNVNRYSLDGTEGTYTSPGGLPGQCKGQFKGKNLILESVVPTHPLPNGPALDLHTRERWELSSDLNKLTIHNDVDVHQIPLNGYQVIEPWTETYIRN